jgi:hypothetical protein
MAGDRLIEEYLDHVARRLPAGRRTRAAVLDELRDGLHEAAAGSGLPPPDAARAAVHRFGAPEVVAAAFAGELATVRARRTVWGFLGTGPLVGVWWLLTFVPRPWAAGPGTVWAAIPVLPVIVAAVLAAVAMLAATGPAARWVPAASPYRAVTMASGIAVACIGGDLAALGTLGSRLLADRPLPWVLAGVAVTASLIRISVSAPALRRLLDTRAALA